MKILCIIFVLKKKNTLKTALQSLNKCLCYTNSELKETDNIIIRGIEQTMKNNYEQKMFRNTMLNTTNGVVSEKTEQSCQRWWNL